jgi:receptor protein-tyrosine kinase
MNPERADRSVIAEEFRHIKRPLLANAFGGDPEGLGQNRNLIMVTSAFPGEGKTFCAINLAMSMAAEMDFKVLLVDADVARPSVFKYLGLREERGLLDVLRDKGLDLAEVLLRTNFEKLTLLPAGRSVRHATELLASDAMNQLLAELASRYSDRVIIFDSPPLLPTSEARVLANHMGQVVMVVEADKTPTAAIKEAATLVEDACDIVMLLLNKTNVSQSAAGYYGYGYGYGHEDA